MPSIDPARDSGFLVTPGDVGALREAVSQLLDHDVSLRLGEGAFEMWEERYSPDRAIASRGSQSRGPMRIAFLYTDALGEGGYPRDVRWLAGALATRGLDVSLVARPGPRTDRLDHVAVVPPSGLGELAPEVDLVHIWGMFVPGQLLLTRGVARRTRLVISPMAQLIEPHLRRRMWKKLPYLFGLRPIVSAWGSAAHLFSDVELPGARRFLRPTSFFVASLGVFPPPEPVPRAPRSGEYLLFLGRNDVYQKGIDLLLSGYGRAVDRGLRLPLLIAGQAHEESGAFIQRRVEALGLADSISLLGEVSEAEKWGLLASARCLAFLSRWDGPPRPIREAIGMGTPVIVTPGTNLGGLVMEAGAGMAVDFDPDAVAEGMVAASMEATVTRWREGVRELKEALSWDRVARDYEEGYGQVLASRPR